MGVNRVGAAGRNARIVTADRAILPDIGRAAVFIQR
jgi:hypothetical protein